MWLENGLRSGFVVQQKIKLPYGPIGFIVSRIIAPLVKYRLNSEFKIL